MIKYYLFNIYFEARIKTSRLWYGGNFKQNVRKSVMYLCFCTVTEWPISKIYLWCIGFIGQNVLKIIRNRIFNFTLGALHKRCHQSREGFFELCTFVYVYDFHSDAQICQIFFPRSRTISAWFLKCSHFPQKSPQHSFEN